MRFVTSMPGDTDPPEREQLDEEALTRAIDTALELAADDGSIEAPVDAGRCRLAASGESW